MGYRPTSHFREALSLDEIPNATATSDGIMSAADKAKLDGIPPGGGGGFIVVAEAVDFAALVGRHYRVDTSGGNVLATLPVSNAGNAGQDVSLKKIASGDLTIAAAVGQLVDGQPSITISAIYTAITLRSTGAGWDIV